MAESKESCEWLDSTDRHGARQSCSKEAGCLRSTSLLINNNIICFSKFSTELRVSLTANDSMEPTQGGESVFVKILQTTLGS